LGKSLFGRVTISGTSLFGRMTILSGIMSGRVTIRILTWMRPAPGLLFG